MGQQYGGTPNRPVPTPGGMPIWAWVAAGIGCIGCFPILLAAAAFPVFARARDTSRARVCYNHVSEINRALLQYSEDYDERLPEATHWMDGVYPYLGSKRLMNCPALPSRLLDDFGYAFNSRLSGASVARLRYAPRTPMVYDSVNSDWNANDPAGSLPHPGRHLGVNTVGYVSGMVSGYRGAGAPR